MFTDYQLSSCDFMNMFLPVLFSKLLMETLAFYEDILPHSGLERVPAVIGSNVQLRCTKITERQSDDVYYTPLSCSPSWQDSCYHAWSKGDGTVLKKGLKYSMQSVITYGFCENFEKTSDLIKNLIPTINQENDKYHKSGTKCYASALLIKDVQKTDFGVYTCNISNHNGNDEYDRNQRSEVRTITLYNAAQTKKPSPSIHYFESFYMHQRKNQLLLQCSVTGESLQWVYYNKHETCNGIISSESEDSSCLKMPIKIAEMNIMTNMWRCFNFSQVSHSPFLGVTESFILFDNICPMDYSEVDCAVEVNGVLTGNYSNKVIVQDRSDDRYGWHNYHYDYLWIGIWIALVTIIPIISILLIIASIIACVRSKLCCSRSKNRFVTMQQQQSNQGVRYVPAQQHTYISEQI